MGWMECGGGLAPLDRTLIGAAVLTCLMSTAPTTRAVAASEQQQLAALPDERSGSDLVPGPRLVQSTQRQAKQLFKLEPQPLAQALRKFSEQTGIQVAYNRAELAGRTTDGLSGVFLPEEVLKKLLAGSGARYRYTYDDAVLVRVAQAAGGTAADVDLATITVQGDGETGGGGSSAETAWGPVDGYVAKKSATATKTGTAPIETPQSISIITRDQMDARAVQNIGEAVQYTAGVRSNLQGESSGLGGSSISIRGFGGDGTAGASENEYIDGLRIRGTDFASAGFEPYLFERVEVLKGPSSVLYGQSTPAGVVNHVSKRPTAAPLREVQVRAGSFDRLEGAFDFSGPIDDEARFSYRLTGLVLDTDAQTDFTSRNRKAIAPALTWRPSAGTTVTVLGTYQEDDFEGGFVNGLPALGTVLDNPNGKLPVELFQGDPSFNSWDRSLYSLGYLLEHRVNEKLQVRQNFRYLHNDLDLESVFGRTLQADLRTLNRASFSVIETSHDFTVDNQAEIRFKTGRIEHTLLFGLDYQKLSRDTLRGFAGAPALDIFNPVYNLPIGRPPIFQSIDTEQDQLGLYAQDQIKFANWVLTLGRRLDSADSETKNNLTGVVTKQSDRAVTSRAGLGYLFKNGLAPYASYSESFEPAPGLSFAGTSFDPTTGTQYEAGVKYQPQQSNSFVTLSAFELTEQNVLTADTVNPGFSVQTGEIRARGVELEAVASLDNGLDITAAYTYLDAEITKDNEGNAGNTPAAVPTHWASVWGDYTVRTGRFAGLGAGVGVRYIGDSFGDNENTFKVPSYVLVDATIHYDFQGSMKGARFAVNASNLFDNEHVSACRAANRCYYGVGRSVLATLKFGW